LKILFGDKAFSKKKKTSELRMLNIGRDSSFFDDYRLKKKTERDGKNTFPCTQCCR
jgi:hypothetical protein